MSNTKRLHLEASRDAFTVIRSWSDEAKRRIKASNHATPSAKGCDTPSAKGLCMLLPEGHPQRSIVDARSVRYPVVDGRQVIAFKTRLRPKLAKKHRHVFPVHFAAMRALEIVPGMKIALANDRNRHRDEEAGSKRSDEDLIFDLQLQAKKGMAFAQTKLDRILFNVSGQSKLYARRTGDHHYIVPSGFVPIRSRIRSQRSHLDQDAILQTIGRMISADPDQAAFSAIEMHKLLSDLFAIGDDLHWDELIDRVPVDEKYQYSVKEFEGLKVVFMGRQHFPTSVEDRYHDLAPQSAAGNHEVLVTTH